MTRTQSAFHGRGEISAGPRLTAMGAMAAIMIFGALNPFEKTFENRLLGFAIVAIGLAPIYWWSANPRRSPIPLLAMMGGFYAVCYGMAGFITPIRYISGITASEGEYTRALVAALISLLMIYAGFGLTLRRAHAREAVDASPMPPHSSDADTILLFGIFPFFTAVKLLVLALHIAGIKNILGVVGDQIFAWIAYATFMGRYRGGTRFAAWAAILVQTLLYGNFLTGVLFSIASVAIILGLSYVAAKRSVPILALVLVVCLALFLQLGKSDYRREVIREGATPSAEQRLTRFYSLSSYRLSHLGLGDSINESYSRYDLLHLTAAVIARTPSVQPFQRGKTYLPILTKWIPRILWRNKPLEDAGNSWAKPYEFLGANDNVTSLNLPWLPEMFMNFGWAGVIAVSLMVGLGGGCIFRWFIVGATSPEKFSAALAIILPIADPESNLSIAVGMVVIAIVCTRLFSLLLTVIGLSSSGRPSREPTMRAV